ncbi:unnamed protein product [Orchesella dallaii]|uniref:Uncharacterized protein n=1 Tax=Orchesella dallaii TaxID=48710 RepID=A0ABP1QCE0_9HEXA
MSGVSTFVVGGKRNKGNRNRQLMMPPAPPPLSSDNGATNKLMIPSRAGDGKRNLLPSRTLVVGSGAYVNSSGTTVSVKTKPGLQNSYEVYLRGLLMNVIVHKTKDLQVKAAADNLTKKCVEAVSVSCKKITKIHANHVVTSLSKNLVSMRKLGCAFWDDMSTFAFTAEESLLQILNVLSSNFDRIVIEGGDIGLKGSGSVFLFHEGKEIHQVLEKLGRGSCSTNRRKESSFEFGFLLNEALKNIGFKLESAKRINGEFKWKLKALLEACYFTIMNRLALNQSFETSDGCFNLMQSLSSTQSFEMSTSKWNHGNRSQ